MASTEKIGGEAVLCSCIRAVLIDMRQLSLFLVGALVQIIVWGGAILAWYAARRAVRLIHGEDDPIGPWLGLGVPVLTAFLIFVVLLKLARNVGK